MILKNLQEKDDGIDVYVELGGFLYIISLNSSIKQSTSMGQLQQQKRSIQPKPVGKLTNVSGTSFLRRWLGKSAANWASLK